MEGTYASDSDLAAKVFRLSDITPPPEGNHKGCPYGKTRAATAWGE